MNNFTAVFLPLYLLLTATSLRVTPGNPLGRLLNYTVLAIKKNKG